MKAHPWLRDFPWDDLYHKRLRASYVPNVSERANRSLKKITSIQELARMAGKIKKILKYKRKTKKCCDANPSKNSSRATIMITQ